MKTRLYRTLGPLLVVLAIAGCATPAPNPSPAPAAPSGPPQSMLWVGNSYFYYNNSMHNQVNAMVRAAKTRTPARDVGDHRRLGIGLARHGVYFRPDGLGRYSFVAGNEIRFNKPGRQYDAVIMMDCSQCPIHPQLGPIFHEYAKKHSDTVGKRRAPGAVHVLGLQGQAGDGGAARRAVHDRGQRQRRAGDPGGARICEGGRAQAGSGALSARQAPPEPRGHLPRGRDGLRRDLEESPVGNKYTATLDPETAAFLQNVAWDTVREYYGK